jgi:predicted metal-dependent phosphotriesterase family hydrolase
LAYGGYDEGHENLERSRHDWSQMDVWDPRSYEDTDYGLEPGESFEPTDAWDVETGVSEDMPHVMTLLGPIDPLDLGVCLHHVHLLCNPVALTSENPDYRLDDPARAEDEIEAFVTMNGRSLVDCSTRDYGRLVYELVDIAGWVPVHLIGVTGRHKHLHASRMPNATDVDALAAEFIGELKQSIEDTSARAGVIKIGTSLDEITEVEAATIEAAAIAHRETGAPITTHTEDGTMALEQIERLGDGGVRPDRVIIGHLDRKPMDPAYLREIASTGAFLSFDQIGKSDRFTDADRAAVLLDLVRDGYEDQILLSEDYGRKSLHLSYGGAPGLAYLQEWFMVMLMDVGLDAMTIRKMVVENPARALTIRPGPASA